MVKKTVSVLINLIQGAAAVVAAAVVYAFVFDAESPRDHDMGLGIFCLMISLFLMIIPNILIKHKFRFHKTESALFQVMPMMIGSAAYIIFQMYY